MQSLGHLLRGVHIGSAEGLETGQKHALSQAE
jgi:hypothetical protein